MIIHWGIMPCLKQDLWMMLCTVEFQKVYIAVITGVKTCISVPIYYILFKALCIYKIVIGSFEEHVSTAGC